VCVGQAMEADGRIYGVMVSIVQCNGAGGLGASARLSEPARLEAATCCGAGAPTGTPRPSLRAVMARGSSAVACLSLFLSLTVTGCTSAPVSDTSAAALRLALDRERLQAEADAAVAITGRRVCRQQRLGLAERETERGVVVRDAQGQWRVRTAAGAEVPALGAGWTICR